MGWPQVEASRSLHSRTVPQTGRWVTMSWIASQQNHGAVGTGPTCGPTDGPIRLSGHLVAREARRLGQIAAKSSTPPPRRGGCHTCSALFALRSSSRRARALPRVRGRSAVSTTPSSMVMIGLTESTPPIAACAGLIRPPRFRYSSVSSTTKRRHVRLATLELGDDLLRRLSLRSRGRPPSQPEELRPCSRSRCRRYTRVTADRTASHRGRPSRWPRWRRAWRRHQRR